MVWPFSSPGSSGPDKKTPVDAVPDHTSDLLRDPAATPKPSKKDARAAEEEAALAELMAELNKDEDLLREEHFKTKYPDGSFSGPSNDDKHDINRRLKESLGIVPPKRTDWGDLAERRRRAEEELDKEPEVTDEEVTDMRCLTYFDNMYYCYSVGGQFLNVYRYGQLRDCRSISADWRFCMRTKVLGQTARRAAIARRFREKQKKVTAGPSSEDVWEVRRGERDNVFWPKIEEQGADGVD